MRSCEIRKFTGRIGLGEVNTRANGGRRYIDLLSFCES